MGWDMQHAPRDAEHTRHFALEDNKMDREEVSVGIPPPVLY